MKDRPWFIWDVPITEAELRQRLVHPDADTRAQWQARIMREARYREVWDDLSIEDILRNWEAIELHLGRRRGFWVYLLEGWRKDGLLPAA